MDATVPTSFIPKKPLAAGIGRKRRPPNFISLVGIVVFVVALFLSAGVFAYQYYLSSSIASAKTSLDSDVKAFDPSFIDQLSRLDSRLKSSDTLLSQHSAISSFFSFLSTVTVSSVRFTSFSYNRTDQGASIVLSGQGKSFSAIAAEENELAQPTVAASFQNAQFSNFGLDKSGNVTFSLSGTINLSSFPYVGTAGVGVTGSSSASTQ